MKQEEETIKLRVDVGLLEIASRLAHCDDSVQAEFFNIFGQELRHVCETEYKAGFQMANVADKVNKETKELFEHITYKENLIINYSNTPK